MSGNLVIERATVIDGVANEPLEDVTVVVRDGRIESIGADGREESPDDTQRLDGRDVVLLPGLIDAHVHLCLSSGRFDDLLGENVASVAFKAARNAAITLARGVTTVRDVGGYRNVSIELARAVRAGHVPGPRIVAAGQNITMTGGHGHFIGVEADGPEALRAAARAQLKAGANGIKLMASGGLAVVGEHPSNPELSDVEMAAAIAEAHNQGKWAAAHAHSSISIHNAVRAGADSIEHGTYIDDEAIRLMVERGVTLVPTFAIYHRMAHAAPDSILAPELCDQAREVFAAKVPLFMRAFNAGVQVATGTDNGPPLGPHGDLALELILLAEAGVPPMQVIRAATINAARLLRVDHLVGTLEPGKHADIVALRGNPLRDMRSVREVAFVVKAGVVYGETPVRALAGVH
jgi:imidazolonepropionase-like amidohydrolase